MVSGDATMLILCRLGFFLCGSGIEIFGMVIGKREKPWLDILAAQSQQAKGPKKESAHVAGRLHAQYIKRIEAEREKQARGRAKQNNRRQRRSTVNQPEEDRRERQRPKTNRRWKGNG